MIAEIKMSLDALVAGDPADVVADQVDTLGWAWQGRPIWGLALGRPGPPENPTPAALFNGLTHAREPESIEIVLPSGRSSWRATSRTLSSPDCSRHPRPIRHAAARASSSTSRARRVRMEVLDLQGRRVQAIGHWRLPPGRYARTWLRATSAANASLRGCTS